MMKKLVYTVIACLGISGYATAQPYNPAVLLSCDTPCLTYEETIIKTFPMHDPIHPSGTDTVTYSLDVEADNGVESIELHEWVKDVDVNGNTSGGSWGTLTTWSYSSPFPQVTQVTHPIGGHPANKYITYKFVVTDNSTSPKTRTHIVSYATQGYLPSEPAGGYQPTPVYVQGSTTQMMDIIFIPDVDITDIDDFHDHCRLMIKDGVFGSGSFNVGIKQCWWRFFNFYINPLEGEAKDPSVFPPQFHIPPANWNQLTFAEGHALMHINNGAFRDSAWGTLFSTKQQDRGTMLHEAGHALFGLADEYYGGWHFEDDDLPNNWSSRPNKKVAKGRGRTTSDVKKIRKSSWYKMCYTNCQMSNSGLTVNGYDIPCLHRVYYKIRENVGCPQPPLPP